MRNAKSSILRAAPTPNSGSSSFRAVAAQFDAGRGQDRDELGGRAGRGGQGFGRTGGCCGGFCRCCRRRCHGCTADVLAELRDQLSQVD